MHAHRCKHCAHQGITTIWIHGDDMAGNPDAHACPKCGEKEWEKWLVETGKLPSTHNHAQHAPQSLTVVSLAEVVEIAFYFLVAACLVYSAIGMWELWQTRKLPKA